MINDVFQIFDSIGEFRGGRLGAITLLKMGLYSIFNEFFHWILVWYWAWFRAQFWLDISLKLGRMAYRELEFLDQIDPMKGGTGGFANSKISWFSIHLFGNTVKLTYIQSSSSFIEFAMSWKPFLYRMKISL